MPILSSRYLSAPSLGPPGLVSVGRSYWWWAGDRQEPSAACKVHPGLMKSYLMVEREDWGWGVNLFVLGDPLDEEEEADRSSWRVISVGVEFDSVPKRTSLGKIAAVGLALIEDYGEDYSPIEDGAGNPLLEVPGFLKIFGSRLSITVDPFSGQTIWLAESGEAWPRLAARFGVKLLFGKR